jgi:tetratricopeptide (TPR) repeat protein
MNLGIALQAEGRDDEAFASLERALALDPALASAHYNVGALHHKRGRHVDAMEHYREAIRLRPGDAQSHFNLALAHFISGRFEDAWTEYAWRRERREHAALLRDEGLDRVAIHAERSRRQPLLPALRPGACRRARFRGRRSPASDACARAFSPPSCRAWRARPRGARRRPFGRPAAPRRRDHEGATTAAAHGGYRARFFHARAPAALGPSPRIALAWRAGEARRDHREPFKEIPIDALGAALRESSPLARDPTRPGRRRDRRASRRSARRCMTSPR